MMNDELKNLEELRSNVRADAANNQTSKSNRHVKLNVYYTVAKSRSSILYFNSHTALVTFGEH